MGTVCSSKFCQRKTIPKPLREEKQNVQAMHNMLSFSSFLWMSILSCFLFLVSCFLFLVSCFLFLVSCFLFLIIVTLNLFTLTDPSLLFFNQHCTQSTLHTINTTHNQHYTQSTLHTDTHANTEKKQTKKQQCMQTYTLCSIGAALTSSIEPNRTRICRIFS